MNNKYLAIFVLFAALPPLSSAMESVSCRNESAHIPKMNYIHLGSFSNETGNDVKLELRCDIEISKNYVPLVCDILILEKSLSHIYLLLNDQLMPQIAQGCLKKIDYDLKKMTFAKLYEWKITRSKLETEEQFLPSQSSVKSNLLRFNRSISDNQSIILEMVCSGLSFQLYSWDMPSENNYLMRGISVCSPLKFEDYKDIFIKDEYSVFSFLPRELIGYILSMAKFLNELDASICYWEKDNWDDFSYTESEDNSESSAEGETAYVVSTLY